MSSRSSAFLLPTIPLTLGLPVIDRRGRRGVVVDVWYSEPDNSMKVKVCRSLRYDGTVKTQTYLSLDIRVDLSSDIGFVHALREYFRLANAKIKEDTKPYAWTWGGLQEQAVKWWAHATDERDEKRLTKKLLQITQTREN